MDFSMRDVFALASTALGVAMIVSIFSRGTSAQVLSAATDGFAKIIKAATLQY